MGTKGGQKLHTVVGGVSVHLSSLASALLVVCLVNVRSSAGQTGQASIHYQCGVTNLQFPAPHVCGKIVTC